MVIGIIGLGLIGGSIAKALKEKTDIKISDPWQYSLKKHFLFQNGSSRTKDGAAAMRRRAEIPGTRRGPGDWASGRSPA